MTGPRVEIPKRQPPHPFSPEAYDAAQPTGVTRGLSPDEFDQAQGMTPVQLKAWKLPPMDEAVKFAPRDVTRTSSDKTTKGETQRGVAGVVGHLINPLFEHPWLSAGAIGATMLPVVGPYVSLAMGGDLVANTALYGYQKHLETQATPEARAIMEADPERISGEAAIAQGIMLGLIGAHAARGVIKATPPAPSMEITGVRPPHGQATPPRTVVPSGDVADMELPLGTNRFAGDLERGAAEADAYARAGNQPARPKGLTTETETSRVGAGAEPVEGLIVPETVTAGRVKSLETQTPEEALAALSADRQAAAEKVAQAEALRPRRRAAAMVQSEQGAELLGTAAAQHGLPADASPYLPNTPQDVAWKAGHESVTSGAPPEGLQVSEPLPSYPEGFTMGGSLRESRIPAKSELPKVAKGSDLPEGATPETIAQSEALKGNPFRGHTTDALAQSALDAQTAIEAAQAAMARTGEGSAEMQRYYNEIGDLTDFAREVGGNPFFAKTPERTLAIAKARMAQIEREYVLRGIRGDDLADVIAGAKEARAERVAMQQEESLSFHTGDDPFAAPAPVAAEAGSAQGLAPVEGTGATRTRGLSAGVNAKAVEAQLSQRLGDLPEYRQISMADQAAKASDLLATDPALARRVALGDAPAPDGLLPESVFVAVENKAIADGDVGTIRDLASGRLTTEATTMGQRIRALGERDPDSPIGAIQSVADVRAHGKDVPTETLRTVAEIKAKLGELTVDAGAWKSFIDSLRC